MESVLRDALIDTAKMIPFLFVIYILISLVENRYGNRLADKVKHAGKAGPLLGALFGIVPQCGFSVISTALYVRRVLSLGTLLAVYLSTSDEAIPIFLSNPNKAYMIAPLLVAKLIIALVAGYAIDFVLRITEKRLTDGETCATVESGVGEEADQTEKGCCGHDFTPTRPTLRQLLYHPSIHTLKVFFFLFVTTSIINLLLYKIGPQNLSHVLLQNSFFQPVIAALIGLIPNCASSVAISEVYLQGGISFGSTVAGLSASAGLGLLVLFKESTGIREALKVVGLLFFVSVLSGIIIQAFLG